MDDHESRYDCTAQSVIKNFFLPVGASGPLFFSLRCCYLCDMYVTTNLRYIAEQMVEIDWEEMIPDWPHLLMDGTSISAISLQLISLHTPYSMEQLITEDLRTSDLARKSRKPGLILLDADGTLTDGGMFYTETGDQIKRFNVKDGMIIHRLIRRQGVMFGMVSSGSAGNILRARAKAIGIQRLYFGTRRKVEVIEEWLEELGLSWAEVAYAGDDLNDLEVIRLAGYSACPADAVRTVREASRHVLTRDGGHGCIREFLEEVLGYEV